MNLKKLAILGCWVLMCVLAISLTYEVRTSNCILPPAQMVCDSLLAVEASLAWLAVLVLTVTAAFDVSTPQPIKASIDFDISKMYWL